MNTLTLRGVKKVSTTTIERESAGAEGISIEYDSQTIIVDMASGDIFFIEMIFEKKGEKLFAKKGEKK